MKHKTIRVIEPHADDAFLSCDWHLQDWIFKGHHVEIITVFSARLYGARSKKNQKLIEGLKEAVDAGST